MPRINCTTIKAADVNCRIASLIYLLINQQITPRSLMDVQINNNICCNFLENSYWSHANSLFDYYCRVLRAFINYAVEKSELQREKRAKDEDSSSFFFLHVTRLVGVSTRNSLQRERENKVVVEIRERKWKEANLLLIYRRRLITS